MDLNIQHGGMFMRVRSVAAITFWFALASGASGQQAPPQAPMASTLVHSNTAGNIAGFKVDLTRTGSGDRETVTEVMQTPGTDGRFVISTKTTTETIGIGSDHVKSVRELLARDPQGSLKLVEKTDADQETFQDGTTRTVENTWAPDLNGRLSLSFRSVQETNAAVPSVRETRMSFYLPGINEDWTEAERVRRTERQLAPNLIQTDSIHDVPDVSGRWQTTD